MMRAIAPRGAAMLALALALTAGAANADPLPAPLRAEVEALKAAVAAAPTDASTVAGRARVLADWVDAHALAGLSGSPWASRARRFVVTPPTGAAAMGVGAQIDAWVREYTVRDETPAALGELRATVGPFEAGTFATITQTWTAGAGGMAVGGGIWVARHFNTMYGAFQTDDPAAAGHITISTSDGDTRFEVDTIMASGAHGGFRAPEPALVFRLVAGHVDAGETVTVTYGDAAGGGPGLRITTVSGENVPLPLYVDVSGAGDWFMLPLQPFAIVGADAVGVHGFAPSVVAPGEVFELSVRAEDQWFNRASRAIPAFDVLVDGAVAASTQGGNAIEIVELAFDEVGPRWIDLRSADGAIEGIANPVLVADAPAERIYWGDTHGHSGQAEGIGTIDYFMRFARNDARLDFVTHSEHDTALDAAEWQQMRAAVAAHYAPGKFIPYLGYEWTVRAFDGGGHHNVLYRNPEHRLPVSALEYPTLSALYQRLREVYDPQDVVVIPHAHNPGDARLSDPLLEPLIEVMSMHGTFEWFMRNYLGNGHQVGFVAASDDHLSHPGYSAPSRDSLAQRGGLGAVLAPERSRDAIFDAMKARRTYATTGERIILDVELNGAGMGERTAFADTRTIKGRVIGTAPIADVTVFKNDAPLWSKDYLTASGAPGPGQTTLHLSFHSDATPHHWGDAPRGWRHWRGRLTLAGGRILAARGTDFANPNVQTLQADGDGFIFKTITRGDASTIVLTVDALTADAKVVLELDETRESGSAPPFYRPPATIAGEAVELRVADALAGRLAQPMPIPGYADSITLRRVLAGERDVAFEHTDADDPRQGDYYYVRVRQADDAAAWSSPIWVGGYPPK